MLRPPAQSPFDCAGIHRVAAVVAGTIAHERDELRVAIDRAGVSWNLRICGDGNQVVEQRADRLHHVEVPLLATSADVEFVAWLRPLEDLEQRMAVIVDVEPIAHVLSVAVDRKPLALERVQDDKRNELFRELVRPVVVRAVGGQRRKSVRCMHCPDEVIRGRLGRRVGGARRVRRELGECARRAQRAEDLVGRHLEEAERARVRGIQLAPVRERRPKERERTDDVGLHEFRRLIDRPVHVRLGSEVHHPHGSVHFEQTRHERQVTDVAVDENVLGPLGQGREVLQVAGVREPVEVHDAYASTNRVVYEVRADEAGATRDEYGAIQAQRGHVVARSLARR